MARTSQTPSGIVTGVDVTATETGNGRNFTTTFHLGSFTLAPTGAAALGLGYLIGTLPAGAQHIECAYMSVAMQGAGVVDADTPDIGVGTVIASGVVSVLGGTATFEDIVDGQTAADCSGTATVALLLPDDTLSVAGDVKAIYLNVADTWAGADTVTFTGDVTITWVKIA